MGEYREVRHYEIVARDSQSVVIQFWSELFEEHQVRQIYFEGEFYCMALGGGLCEYFRRIT